MKRGKSPIKTGFSLPFPFNNAFLIPLQTHRTIRIQPQFGVKMICHLNPLPSSDVLRPLRGLLGCVGLGGASQKIRWGPPSAPRSVMDLGSYHAFCPPNSVFLLQLNGSLNPGLSAVMLEKPLLPSITTTSTITTRPSPNHSPTHRGGGLCQCRPFAALRVLQLEGDGRTLAISRLSQRSTAACCCCCCCYFR